VHGVVRVSECRDGVRTITLNRPERLNAITPDLVDGLHSALDLVERDPSCRVAILTGSGRGFCAGADLHAAWDCALGGGTPPPVEDSYRNQMTWSALVARMRAMPVVFIAAVNGPAAGGGLALALAADLRIASTSAAFLVANVKIGLSGGEMGISYLLPRLVGSGLAADMMYTGRTVDAEEALARGLVSTVATPDELLEHTAQLAAQICANAPFGVALTKEMFQLGLDAASLEHTMVLENRTQVLAGFSRGPGDAVAAFRRQTVSGSPASDVHAP
jgi:enoyl-CoA hydratase